MLRQIARFASTSSRGPAQVTKLANGLVVASFEDAATSVATVSAFVKAGSRFEDSHSLGASHVLRRVAFQSTNNRTAFRIAREAENAGSQLSASSSREHLAYTVDLNSGNLPAAVDLLSDVVTSPAFHSWELKDTLPFVHLDILEAQAEPSSLALDQAHKIAFRNTLGQPLVATETGVHHLDTAALKKFHSSFFAPSRTALVGYGVNHAELVKLAEQSFGKWNASGSEAKNQAAQYKGGSEMRLDLPSSLTYAVLAHQGASAQSNDFFAQAVLQQVLGSGPVVKYGASVGRLQSALAKANSGPVSASAISASYSDAGLVGAYVVGTPSAVAGALQAVARELKRVGSEAVSSAELNRAKSLAKANLAFAVESRHGAIEDLGRQALIFGSQATSLAKALEGVDAVSAESLSKFAKQVTNSAPSYSVAGDVTQAPWLDELTRA